MLKTLIFYRANDFTVVSDSEKFNIRKLYNLSVGRTKYIASGIKVNNTIESGDGRFYCMLVQNLNLFKAPSLIRKVYSGKKIINNSHLSLSYCRSIEIYGNSLNSEVEFDGDPGGYLPCKIEMASEPLDLLVEA